MVGSTRDNSLHLKGTKSSKQRRVYLDLINSVAIMWVVLLHVRFITPDNPSSSAWWVENILSGFGVAAVPLFFMATGINLLDFTRRESIGTFYRKRFTKILIPMILWAQVYLFVHMWTGSTPFPGVHEILRTLVAPSSEVATFWYLEALVGVYLVLPIFSYAIRGVQTSYHDTHRILLAYGGTRPCPTDYHPGNPPDLPSRPTRVCCTHHRVSWVLSSWVCACQYRIFPCVAHRYLSVGHRGIRRIYLRQCLFN